VYSTDSHDPKPKAREIMLMNWFRNMLLSLVAAAMALAPLCGGIQACFEGISRGFEKRKAGFRMMMQRQGRF
jgi:hypothetical protein